MRFTSSAKLRHWLALAMLLLAAGVGLVQVRKVAARPDAMTDFSNVYLGARCLVERCDPYVAADVAALGSEHGVPLSGYPLLYPPSALLLATPLSAVAWPAAIVWWDGLSLLALAFACALMVEQFGLERSPVALVPVLALIFSTPFANVLLLGNPALMSVALAALGSLLMLPANGERGAWRSAVGAALLGCALALKPQMAVGALAALLLHRPTRTAAVKAGAVALIFLVIAVVAYRWRLGSFEFLRHLLETRQAYAPGGVSDQSALNPASRTFLGLQAIGSALGWQGPLPTVMAWGLTVLFAALALWRRMWVRFPWSTVALMTLVSVFPMYHRKYDRVILLLLVPAVVELWGAGYRALSVLLAGAIVLFADFDQIFDLVLGRLLKLPLAPLIELAMSFLLVYAMGQRGHPAADGSSEQAGS